MAEPTPPTLMDTTYVAPTGATLDVFGGENLQTALDAAQPGDLVRLEDGATFTGNFTLPVKGGANYIHVRGATGAGQPEQRVVTTLTGSFPKIVSPNSLPAIGTVNGSHHYRFIGLEVSVAPGVPYIFAPVQFGGSQDTVEQAPHHLILDRCYVHGQLTGDVQRGVSVDSAFTAVIDSHIAEAHGVGMDTQAICGVFGQGPIKIVNNYLEGAGENVMFGGGDAPEAMRPCDIEIRDNYVTKKLSWHTTDPSYAGTHWTVKNLLELKNCHRVLITRNIFEHCWVDGQIGQAVLITPRNQNGSAPWSGVQDVAITHNLILDAEYGFDVSGGDGNQVSEPTERVTIRHNLAVVKKSFARMLGEAGDDFTFDHNTGLGYTIAGLQASGPHGHVVFANNLLSFGLYGIIGDSASPGQGTVDAYFADGTFLQNLFVVGVQGFNLATFPATTMKADAIADVDFIDSTVPGGNYRLLSSSPYFQAALDGTDLGANINALPQPYVNRIRFVVRH